MQIIKLYLTFVHNKFLDSSKLTVQIDRQYSLQIIIRANGYLRNLIETIKRDAAAKAFKLFLATIR